MPTVSFTDFIYTSKLESVSMHSF